VSRSRPAPSGRALSAEQKDAVLGVISEAWKYQPELRLGQLIDLVARKTWAQGEDGYLAAHAASNGLFYVEDADLAHAVWLYASRQHQAEP
jgi:hypothetical protein